MPSDQEIPEKTVDSQVNEDTQKEVENSVKEKRRVVEGVAYESESDSEEIDLEKAPESLRLKYEKLKALRQRLSDSTKANRQDLYAEHQRNKTNPKEEARNERKKAEAERLLARKEATENGEDYERKRFWDYSVERVENWEKKQEKKAKRADTAFTDYNQVAHKKYKKLINELKPDLNAYNEQKLMASTSGDAEEFYQDANSLSFVENKPDQESVDRLVSDVQKQIDKRAKVSRRRAFNEEDDVTYINERNMHFNRKISRAYDKYTKEIRDNFERGTAL
ncbi:SYF2-domain-containing protein [Basidiobolus meristosporus CBS 931.73]|uniref:Pre-mRNA-splicing factor SYF2 n=1 Tax=Basidiobolus meristosporus CBS 931.73 TaxID=1314790 RepID=A0A1Y1ZDK1_9FUNG|nr:SYF2-domain-containing protein [Basidiobolus meristosporus CBS 931.73]|eukprot:ORY08318.1 SYF2-domain-containing protein [Basidiobolus meristosporus CBS 931.73]